MFGCSKPYDNVPCDRVRLDANSDNIRHENSFSTAFMFEEPP